ncbi:MAG TPA: RICIN domain-containing protein [Pseudonocardiaceae bacterium]|jgi:hypothetical protein|nr:RICIN domain-containing protein [Pseudonocardiaceae bacterium]
MKFFAPITNALSRRAVRGVAVVALGVGAALATAGAASAAPAAHPQDAGWQISWSSPYLITASYDLLNVAVSQGSTANGAPIIQWPADGGSEQVWYFGTETYDGVYQGTVIDNGNSGKCIQTDGVAGDGLTQGTCYYGDTDQEFSINGSLGGYDSFQNVATGLYLDVSGYSWSQGANIDLWYNNAQPNQTFHTLQW